MTEFLTLAMGRYSLRDFDSRAIEPEKLSQVLEAGRVAPTACNNQPQRIKVITDAEGLAKVDECTSSRFGAPAVLLVCYDKTACWTRRFDGATSGVIDASIVATHLALAAHELGLGSCWVMHFDPAKTTELFALPKHIVPVAMLPMGYPAQGGAPSDRHGARFPLEHTLLK